MAVETLPGQISFDRGVGSDPQRYELRRENSFHECRNENRKSFYRQASDGSIPLRVWRQEYKGPRYKRQVTFSESWTNEFVRKEHSFLPLLPFQNSSPGGCSNAIGNKSAITGYLQKRPNSNRTDRIALEEGSDKINSKSFSWQSFTTGTSDGSGLTSSDWNSYNKRIVFSSADRSRLRGITLNGLKVRSIADLPERNEPAEAKGLLNSYRQTCNQRELNILCNSMSSLKVDNRQDLASNDHARHHNKRHKQWIRSEQVKNWRRSNYVQIRGNGYISNSSSGQKSDVISGNSDETLHTSSSSEEQTHVIDSSMDLERRQTVDKCLKWMNSLPDKFSGMHMYTTNGGD